MSAPIDTASLLVSNYPALITQAHLAAIFGQHTQTIRKLARTGKLPFPDVSLTSSEKRYRLADVISYLENPSPKATPEKRRGRPVGSRNKSSHAPK